MNKIFILTGEPSGDKLASTVISKLKINNPNIEVTQSFKLRSEKDLNVDVSDIINVWYSSSNNIGGFTDIQNNGFIVKR